jgi:hypothetical protein
LDHHYDSSEIRTLDWVPSPPAPPFVVPGSLLESSAKLAWVPGLPNGLPIKLFELQCSHKVGEWAVVGTSKVPELFLKVRQSPVMAHKEGLCAVYKACASIAAKDHTGSGHPGL